MSGRIGSSITKAPATSPSTPTNTHEEPSSIVRRRTSRARGGSDAPPATYEACPSTIRCPSTSPLTPAPYRSSTSCGNESSLPRSRAARTIAVASTCGETWSSEAASRSSSSGDTVANASTSATCGTPEVSVPVLSNSRIVDRATVSSAPPPLTMIPRLAAREMPATIAIGTARINGHGVATTSTDSARTGSPEAIQAAPAITSVIGMNQNAYRSARRTAGARSASAASTSRTMPA